MDNITIEKLRTLSPLELKELIENVGAENIPTDYDDIYNAMTENDWISAIEIFYQELEDESAFYSNFFEWNESYICNYIMENGLS